MMIEATIIPVAIGMDNFHMLVDNSISNSMGEHFMEIQILGFAKDLRTNTHVVYAQLPILDYLAIVGENFADFEIQRRREKHKAYKRMKIDISSGALLPSITLAIKPEKVDDVIQHIENKDNDNIIDFLSQPGQVYILDGLQRTYILNDLKSDDNNFRQEQYVLVEFWFEKNIRNLIYRIIILNAGQKSMSVRHQIELLFMTVKSKLENDIPGLEIYTEREVSRRTRSRKYALDKIASAYQSFITKTPEVQRENIIAQNLIEEEIFSSGEEELGKQFEDFSNYLSMYANLDDHICRIYKPGRELPNGTEWFGSENVMNAFFAAISEFGTTPSRITRIDSAYKQLYAQLSSTPESETADPLGLELFQKIVQGINTRKVNVGLATRRLLNNVFKEFFREEGEISLAQFWSSEAE